MIYALYPPDDKYDDWLFREDDTSGKLILKEAVKPYGCTICGKIPEETVIRKIGVQLEFFSKNKKPAFATLDDWLIVTAKTAINLSQYNISAVAVNTNQTLFALLPPAFPVNQSLAGFEYGGNVCKKCGRPKEAIVGPLVDSHVLPEKPPLIWTTQVHNESIIGSNPGIWFEKINLNLIKEIFGKSFDYQEGD